MTQISCCFCTWLNCRTKFLIKFQQFVFLNVASFAPEKLWGFVLGSPCLFFQQQGLSPSAGFEFGSAGTGRLQLVQPRD